MDPDTHPRVQWLLAQFSGDADRGQAPLVLAAQTGDLPLVRWLAHQYIPPGLRPADPAAVCAMADGMEHMGCVARAAVSASNPEVRQFIVDYFCVPQEELDELDDAEHDAEPGGEDDAEHDAEDDVEAGGEHDAEHDGEHDGEHDAAEHDAKHDGEHDAAEHDAKHDGEHDAAEHDAAIAAWITCSAF